MIPRATDLIREFSASGTAESPPFRIRIRVRASWLLPASLLWVACAAAPEPVDSEPEPTRVRTALAQLTVENRTGWRLDIAYCLTRPPATRTVVGRVDAGSPADMAPVPAGEPLVLIARTPGGAEYAMPPRTLQLDEHWVWTIPAGTRFVQPEAGSACTR